MDTAGFLMLLLSSSLLFFEGNSLDVPSDIESALKEMRAALSAQQEEIKLLQEENKAQEAALERLQTGSSVTEHKVEALTHHKTVRQVAFSAALVDSGAGRWFGPFESDTTLVYKHVVTNTGNAYDPDTGV
uniref:C1q domain-containing protein n=1 Tax=Knipowitschia caucasica TaxID=637954 RepID=A0AAV2J3J9_KNICA